MCRAYATKFYDLLGDAVYDEDVTGLEAVSYTHLNDVSFVGDSLTQGMQLYEEGMQNAMFCAYKGVGPNVIVNGTTDVYKRQSMVQDASF